MKLISEQVLAIIKKEYPKAMLRNYTVTKKEDWYEIQLHLTYTDGLKRTSTLRLYPNGEHEQLSNLWKWVKPNGS
jgi:hypothetical protein